MKIEDIKQAITLTPFTLFTSDGKEIHIPHQDYVFFAPVREVLIVVSIEGKINLIDPKHITRIEH